MNSRFASEPFANKRARVLVADGNADDLFFVKRALSKAGLLTQSTFAQDVAQLTQYLLAATHPDQPGKPRLPRLLLLDPIKLSLIGFDILRWLRSQTLLRQIPIVVFTGLEDPRTRDRAFALGVKRYLIKGSNVLEWSELFLELVTEFGLSPEPSASSPKFESCLHAA